MEGIINAVGEPEYVWWPGFFEKFMTRQLEDIPAQDFLATLQAIDQIDFYEEKDTARFNEWDYEDLSAKLYKVNFLFPEFENEASLNLKVGPSRLNLDYVTAMAFGLKNSQFEYFDHGSDLTITNLKALLEHGVDLRETDPDRAYASRAVTHSIGQG